MKHLFIIFLLPALAAVSCTSSRKITYFQGIDETEEARKAGEYEVRIGPDDNLHISVSSINPDAANIFNSTNTLVTTNSEALNITGYLVDRDGYINFPVLGRIKVGGMTKMEATEYIQNGVSEYLKDPTVNIRFLNFKVTVLGEVVRPGTYSVKD
ncbi:MAG: polysaccharide biosynthesis/export family protein [Rikenellaceae bacterium]|nr:polysaccharide biosynthesis/export family protein [Rikenellaceae bacterium]